MKASRTRVRAVALAAIPLAAIFLTTLSPTASADVDTATGAAYAATVQSSLLGSVIAPTPLVTGTATEPTNSFGPTAQSAIPVNIPGLLSIGALNASTEGDGVAAGDPTGHLGFAQSRASVADVIVGLNAITLDAVESGCRSDGDGSTGFTELVGGVLNGNPLITSPLANTQLGDPGHPRGHAQRADPPGHPRCQLQHHRAGRPHHRVAGPRRASRRGRDHPGRVAVRGRRPRRPRRPHDHRRRDHHRRAHDHRRADHHCRTHDHRRADHHCRAHDHCRADHDRRAHDHRRADHHCRAHDHRRSDHDCRARPPPPARPRLPDRPPPSAPTTTIPTGPPGPPGPPGPARSSRTPRPARAPRSSRSPRWHGCRHHQGHQGGRR